MSSLSPDVPPLETNPSGGQQIRLGAWLHEVARACRRNAIRLVNIDGEMGMVDMINDTLIGVGLVTFEDDDGNVRQVECDGSILDGVWLVENEHGETVEQRSLKRKRQ